MARSLKHNKRKRSKRPLHDETDSDDTTVCSTPLAAISVRNSKNHSKNTSTRINPFTLLSDDVHGHIFSFLLCLRMGYAKPAPDAVTLFVQANRQKQGDKTDEYILANKFHMLPQEEQQQWRALSYRDHLRCLHEEQQYTRPHTLVELLQTLSLVSRKWRDVVGTVVNAQAPSEILSPHELACLKSRALSLSFVEVANKFLHAVEKEYGHVTFAENDYAEDSFGFPDERTPLQVVTEHFEVEGNGMASVVAVEYARFLVIRCVELMAAAKFPNTDSRVLAAWKQPSRPCEIVDLFWKAYLTFSPRQYARDCRTLLHPLLLSNTTHVDLLDCIIDYNKRPFSNTNNYYEKKRAFLFSFETQLADGDSFYGKFGTYCVALSTQCLLQDSLDLVRVAKQCREEADYDEDM